MRRICSIAVACIIYGVCSAGLINVLFGEHSCAFERAMKGPDYSIDSFIDLTHAIDINILSHSTVEGNPHKLFTIVAAMPHQEESPVTPDGVILAGNSGIYYVPSITELGGYDARAARTVRKETSVPITEFKANIDTAHIYEGAYTIGFQLKTKEGAGVVCGSRCPPRYGSKAFTGCLSASDKQLRTRVDSNVYQAADEPSGACPL